METYGFYDQTLPHFQSLQKWCFGSIRTAYSGMFTAIFVTLLENIMLFLLNEGFVYFGVQLIFLTKCLKPH